MYYIAFALITLFIIRKVYRKFVIDESDPLYQYDKQWSDEMNGL